MKKLLLLIFWTIFVQTANAQTRLGLHVTQEELAIWRDRANNGPYKVAGDAQTNSPGDWARIIYNANNFKNNTVVGGKAQRDADRFVPWSGTGCYPKITTDLSNVSRQAGLLKDAAFVYLVKEDASYLTAVKAEILAYARNPLLNFADRSRWCNIPDQQGGFVTSEVLTRILFAYDYARTAGGFTDPEQEEVQAWLYKAGRWLADGIDDYYKLRFVNRLAGDYTLTNYSIGADAANPHHTLYYGGPVTGFFTDGFNNRILTSSRFVAMVAVMNNASDLQTNVKRVFKEFIRFSVFPGGDMADMTRWRAPDSFEGPETGLDYSLCMTQDMCDIADVFARNGDNSLYTYSTELGAFGTASPGNPKSLLQVIQNLQKYLNGTHTRYGYGSATSDPAYLIDGVETHLQPKGAVTFDTWFALSNRYYGNAAMTLNYLRTTSGNKPFPATPRPTGSNHSWGGQAAIYPGSLLMFQTTATPYPSGSLIAQTISFNTVPAKVFGAAAVTLSASATSGLTVSFSLVSGPATLVGSTLTFTGAGNVVVKAFQAGNGSYYAAADVPQMILVAKRAQIVSGFPAFSPKSISDPAFTVAATLSSGLTPTIVSNTAVLLAVPGQPGMFSIEEAGTASITVSHPGNANYLPFSQTNVFEIIVGDLDGLVDVLDGKTPSKTFFALGTAPEQIGVYQLNYNLGGNYILSQLSFTTGFDQPLDVWKRAKFQYWNGSAWANIVPEITNNTLATITLSFAPVTAIGMVRVQGLGNSYTKVQVDQFKIFARLAP